MAKALQRSRFKAEQIIGILKEQEAGAKTADVCSKHGISDATFYKYKAKCGGMDVSEACKLKALENENAKLKKLLADAMLDNAILKDVALKRLAAPDVKRDAVAHVCAQHGVSQRQACEVLAVEWSSMRYRSVRLDNASICEAMKKVASEWRRFGYRRVHVMLHRQEIVINLKKLRRFYREEKLAARKRGGRKRASGKRRSMALPSRPNERRSPDFISDAFTDGRRFRVLAVVDDFTRKCESLVADISLSGARLARELEPLIAMRQMPRTSVSDNGTEMTSMPILKWCHEAKVECHYIAAANRFKTASSKVSMAASVTNA